MIENKWKLFAMSQTLCDWNGDCAEIFDSMVESTADELVKVFEDYAITVWYPFSDQNELTVAEHIYELARCAQEVANDE